MAGYVGLVAVVVIVIFVVGVLFGVIVIVAAGVRAEDGATMRRRDRALVLRDGVGQRIGGRDSDDQ